MGRGATWFVLIGCSGENSWVAVVFGFLFSAGKDKGRLVG